MHGNGASAITSTASRCPPRAARCARRATPTRASTGCPIEGLEPAGAGLRVQTPRACSSWISSSSRPASASPGNPPRIRRDRTPYPLLARPLHAPRGPEDRLSDSPAGAGFRVPGEPARRLPRPVAHPLLLLPRRAVARHRLGRHPRHQRGARQLGQRHRRPALPEDIELHTRPWRPSPSPEVFGDEWTPAPAPGVAEQAS